MFRVKLDLPHESASPNGNDGGSDDGKTDETASATFEVRAIEDEESDDEGAENGACTFEGSVKRTSRTIEIERIHGTLVGIEPVGSEEHGEKGPHAPVLEY